MISPSRERSEWIKNPETFLQTREWGEFQKQQGKQLVFWRGNGAEYGLGIVADLGFGYSYVYFPRGPHLDSTSLADFYKEVVAQCSKKVAFIRIEPAIVPKSESDARIFSTIAVQPAATRIIDLSQSTEDILSQMHQKTRYNIRLASRRGVSVRAIRHDEFGTFLDLIRTTADRNEFRAHPLTYYEGLSNFFREEVKDTGKPFIRTYGAWINGELISGIMVLFYGTTAIYLHGASASKHRESMGPYVLQWHALEDAKGMGYHAYDFWGIDPSGDPRHPWAGITRFKNGFGGRPVLYPGTFDVTHRPRFYALYTLVRALRRIR